MCIYIYVCICGPSWKGLPRTCCRTCCFVISMSCNLFFIWITQSIHSSEVFSWITQSILSSKGKNNCWFACVGFCSPHPPRNKTNWFLAPTHHLLNHQKGKLRFQHTILLSNRLDALKSVIFNICWCRAIEWRLWVVGEALWSVCVGLWPPLFHTHTTHLTYRHLLSNGMG